MATYVHSYGFKNNTMDNKDIKGPQDRSRINTSEKYEMNYWAQKFGVSEQQLFEAVNAVGSNSVEKVGEFLRNKNKG